MHLLKTVVGCLLLTILSCENITNKISLARLDCGADVDAEKTYIQFIDGEGQTFSSDELELRSLDGSKQSTALTSQGCLQTNSPGLWLIRHRLRAEGAILDTRQLPVSNRVPLHDISKENLQPRCPVEDISTELDLTSLYIHDESNDLRGYEIQLTVTDTAQKTTKEYPWINFKFLAQLGLQSVFPEGPKVLTIKTLNHFRQGEVAAISCQARFDYTGPDIGPDLSAGQLASFQKKPFVLLEASRVLIFKDRSGDLKSVDVCWQNRPDWNLGNLNESAAPICEKPDSLSPERPISMSQREGFWQLQYRARDRAGNMSPWSSPTVILLAQNAAAESLKKQAIQLQNLMDVERYDASNKTMLMALDIYQKWTALPTAFEKERLSETVLFSLHRTWFQKNVYQTIWESHDYMTKAPLSFPLLLGKKMFISQMTFINQNNKKFRSQILDLETHEVQEIPELTDVDLNFRFKAVSEDGKRFFTVSYDGRLFVGTFNGKTYDIHSASLGQEALKARFIHHDSEIVVLVNGELQYFGAEDKPLLPAKKVKVDPNVVTSGLFLAADGMHYLTNEDVTGGLMRFSFLDATEPGVFVPFPLAEFPEITWDSIDNVLESDQDFSIKLSNADKSCEYAIYRHDAPESEKIRIVGHKVGCGGHVERGGGDIIFYNGDMEILKVWTQPIESFRQNISPKEFLKKSLVAARSRVLSKDGKWMFSGDYEDPEGGNENSGVIHVWERDTQGIFQYRTVIDACGTVPLFLQYIEATKTLVSACQETVDIWDLKNIDDIQYRGFDVDSIIRGMAVTDSRTLFIADFKGTVYKTDLTVGLENPILSRVKLSEGMLDEMFFDAENQRLWLINNQVPQNLVYWDHVEPGQTFQALSSFTRGARTMGVSPSGDYFAAADQLGGEPDILIWNNRDLSGKPVSLTVGSDFLGDFSFFGSTQSIVTGDTEGRLRIYDSLNPEIPPLTMTLESGSKILNVVGLRDRSSFVLESLDGQVYQYTLDDMDSIARKTCKFVEFSKPCLTSDKTPTTPQ